MNNFFDTEEKIDNLFDFLISKKNENLFKKYLNFKIYICISFKISDIESKTFTLHTLSKHELEEIKNDILYNYVYIRKVNDATKILKLFYAKMKDFSMNNFYIYNLWLYDIIHIINMLSNKYKISKIDFYINKNIGYIKNNIIKYKINLDHIENYKKTNKYGFNNFIQKMSIDNKKINLKRVNKMTNNKDKKINKTKKINKKIPIKKQNNKKFNLNLLNIEEIFSNLNI